MNHIKLSFIVLIFSVFIFSSCKDESINVPKNTVESTAAQSSIKALKSHFNQDGTLRDGENPANNIIFDFCFDFVYPITLSYNTGSEVTIQDFNGLIAVLINMSDDLYINGIAFPFQVEVFNDATNSFEVVSIQNEESFMDLLENCSIDDDGNEEDCVCTEEYAPVCVQVMDSSGESFTIGFPNMCVAECEGFTQDDVVDCDYSNPADGDYFDDCFDMIYPFSVVNADGETIQINDEDDFEAVIYANYYFDFVYPITVESEVNSEEGTIVVNNEEELATLLMQCDDEDDDCNCTDVYEPVCVLNPENGETITFDNECEAICEGFTPNNFVDCNTTGGNNCDISNLSVSIGDCISTTAYSISLDFDISNYDGDTFNVTFDGTTTYSYAIVDLPITIDLDINPNNATGWLLVSTPDNTCEEDINWNVPNCE